MTAEPLILRLGKAFGAEVAAVYLSAGDLAGADKEATVARGSGRARWDDEHRKVEPPGALLGRSGRIDVRLEGRDGETGLPFYVVVEIKNTDWDRQAGGRVGVNVGRHRRQVWSYLEPLLDRADAGEVAWAQAALAYPARPRTAGRADAIEAALADHGITAVWVDELPAA